MLIVVLVDEIFELGEGQIKVLFCVGGNFIVVWFDQIKMKCVMDEFDFLVCIDVKMFVIFKLVDYIFFGKICLECEDVMVLFDIFYEEFYVYYIKVVCELNGEFIEEWEFYWEIVYCLGFDIKFQGGSLDMDVKLIKFDVFEVVQKGVWVLLEELCDFEGGKIFDDLEIVVEFGLSDVKF